MSGELGWYRELIVEFSDGKREHFEITRKPTGTHIPAVAHPAPWTKLGYNKCPCCPLPGDLGFCPAALVLQNTLERLRERTSVEMVTATVVDENGRKEAVTVPLQEAGAVLVQLAVFASECPVGRRLKPHMGGLSPFLPASELISKVLERLVAAGGDVNAQLKPLHEVFVYLLGRLGRGGTKNDQDAIPNSVVRVDAIAQALAFRAKRLNDGLAGQLGWKEEKKGEAPSGVWGKVKGLFGA